VFGVADFALNPQEIFARTPPPAWAFCLKPGARPAGLPVQLTQNLDCDPPLTTWPVGTILELLMFQITHESFSRGLERPLLLLVLELAQIPDPLLKHGEHKKHEGRHRDEKLGGRDLSEYSPG
jgi:hypothetical protein